MGDRRPQREREQRTEERAVAPVGERPGRRDDGSEVQEERRQREDAESAEDERLEAPPVRTDAVQRGEGEQRRAEPDADSEDRPRGGAGDTGDHGRQTSEGRYDEDRTGDGGRRLSRTGP